MPEITKTKRDWEWATIIPLSAFHVFALFAILPHFLTWYNLIACFVLLQITGGLGISIGYHRMLSHRSFNSFHPIFGFFHTLCGVLALQMGPISWSRIHRAHHRFTDTPQDPHDQNKGFFHVHIGWMLEKWDATKYQNPNDLEKIWYVAWMEKHFRAINITFLLILFAIGYYFGAYDPFGWGNIAGEKYILEGTIQQGLMGGLGMLVWGGFIRIIILYNLTWSINSLCHRFGYKNFNVDSNTGSSTNNFFIGYFSFGEGWHNNHHRFPGSAKFAYRWWEFDISWTYILLMAKLKLCNPRVHDMQK